MTQFSVFQEELGLYKANKQLSEEGFSAESITAGDENLSYVTDEGVVTEGTIYDVIPSLKGSSFEGKMEIIKGELLINSQDMTEIKVAQSMGIEVNPYIIVDGELKSDGANLALMDSTGTLTIPEGVTKIGEGAFADLSGLKTIIIPGTVREIGMNAFRNNADLETVILQEGVEVIGESGFAECCNLKNIELPESLIDIGQYAFYQDNSLDNVMIPSKITTINTYTFYGCSSLTNIKLPERLQAIRNFAFQSCGSLEEIYIPTSVKIIENNAFSNCTSLSNIEVASDNQYYRYDEVSGMLMTTDGTNIVFMSDAILKETNTLIIPEGLTNFDVTIHNYTNLTMIKIPKSLEKLGGAVIFPITINNVEVMEGNNYFTVENKCLYNKEKTSLMMCFTKDTTVELVNTLTTIGSYSFKQAPNIKIVNLPNSVTTIESRAFETTCKQIENISIGANVTLISSLFKYGNYYGTVTIDENNPNYTVENNELYNKDKTELIAVLYQIKGQYTVKDSVTVLGDFSLYNQDNMTGIILSERMNQIQTSAFGECDGLTSVYIPNSTETIGTNTFRNARNLTQIQIDKEPGSIVGSPWGAIRGDRIVEWLR